ncbi:energy transducer TonB [Novosphingobium sp.]|uniref:energy transducer TonB n=1 Tax=Novosphingobium sp. TaxID=1874826 RepID=UPI002615B01D|nr:energy transducer TonB [Novosphingobium sp.]
MSDPALVKVKPKFLRGDRAEFPAEAKALGHHGTAVVEFVIDAAGAVSSATLRTSTGSSILDKAALTTANTARFTPARDSGGNAIPLKFVTGYEFYQSKSHVPGGGLVHYTCDAFTREMDWWDAQHPDRTKKDSRDQLETMLVGFRLMFQPGGAMAGGVDGIRKKSAEHDAAWSAVRKDCRANPADLFVDHFDMRDMLIRLSKVAAGQRN